jgi:transcriptional regulator with XRE-family HTH domain
MPIHVLGSYIRQRRKHLGLTQEKLAEQIGEGCRMSDISRLECGHIRTLNLSMMESLAAALDISLETLPIARGGVDQTHVAAAPPSGGSAEGIPLKDVLAEFDAIQDLERLAASRSQYLRRTIRELESTTKAPDLLIAAD